MGTERLAPHLMDFNYGTLKHCCHFHNVLRGHLVNMKVPLLRGGTFQFLKDPPLREEEIFRFRMFSSCALHPFRCVKSSSRPLILRKPSPHGFT
jgi:hypothetical protein